MNKKSATYTFHVGYATHKDGNLEIKRATIRLDKRAVCTREDIRSVEDTLIEMEGAPVVLLSWAPIRDSQV